MSQTETEKWQTVSSFLEINKISKTGSIAQFRAIVEYEEFAIRDITKVFIKLDSYYYGDIEVYETDKIDMSILHTGFSVLYNDYHIENVTLVIKGTANIAKGGKDYTIKITPITK